MMTAFLAAAVLFQPAIQDTQTYSDPQLGLSFNHPSTWIIEKPLVAKNVKKGKKKPDAGSVHFRIPLTGAVDDADLVVVRAAFSGSSDTWQQVQADANKNLNRTVERQWQQEILGVPLLLTKIDYTENGSSKVTVTGLLYNDAPNKLLFRLTGPSSDFDKAQFQFNQALETLRTTDNTLPKAQDPNAAPTKKETKVDPKELKHPLFVPPAPPKPKPAPVAIPLVVSTKRVEVRVPEGWRAEHVSGASFTLRNAGLPYPIDVRVATSLDSDPPQTALMKSSAASLADFDKVDRREDDPISTNLAGCVVTSIWRQGSNAKGKLTTMEAAGVSGDFYFVAGCRPTTGPEYLAQRKTIEALLNHISIETLP